MLLLLPDGQHLTVRIRYWLEDVVAAGVRVGVFTLVNLAKGVFLKMIEIELKPISAW